MNELSIENCRYSDNSRPLQVVYTPDKRDEWVILTIDKHGKVFWHNQAGSNYEGDTTRQLIHTKKQLDWKKIPMYTIIEVSGNLYHYSGLRTNIDGKREVSYHHADSTLTRYSDSARLVEQKLWRLWDPHNDISQCPLSEGLIVEVKHQSGKQNIIEDVSSLDWGFRDDIGRIIAYRIIGPRFGYSNIFIQD